MSEYILALIFLPILFAITLPFTSVRVRNIASYFYVLFLIFISLNVFFNNGLIFQTTFSHLVHNILIGLDFVLLAYFIFQGFKFKNNLVLAFAIVQVILFSLFLTFDFNQTSSDILVDRVSSFMLLVINIIGGIIIIYSLKYIDSEDFKQCKKNAFVAVLFFFLAVMNLIVTTNNIEIFFLAFELTTLCSYLLIRYRFDDVAINNALRALWMNQIGGVVILLALIASAYTYDTIYFDILLLKVDGIYLLPISLLIIASFVKGASIPFQNWLLGAMVAPTPVSAILHSATMVKIAPYLILKIAPAFSPLLASFVVFFGSFVFMGASLLALSKDFFKEILGLSTIALLALMMAVAAIGTQEAINICLILIVFHAISKALLFLQAGILEKQYHLKYLGDINHLVSKSKLLVFSILFGFASLTLPPFGAFIGKFTTIELLSSKISSNPLYLFSLLFTLIGSVLLTLLYFKVVTKLLTKDKQINQNIKKLEDEKTLSMPYTYIFTSLSLVFLLIYGIYESYVYNFLSPVEILIPTMILVFTFIALYFSQYKIAHRVKEYHCGEKDEPSLGAYYFDIDDKFKRYITQIAIGLMIIIVLIGLM